MAIQYHDYGVNMYAESACEAGALSYLIIFVGIKMPTRL
jgi:hypothetical protein